MAHEEQPVPEGAGPDWQPEGYVPGPDDPGPVTDVHAEHGLPLGFLGGPVAPAEYEGQQP